MTFTQLLLSLATVAGVLLMTALAVVPTWLDHDGAGPVPR